MKQKLILFSSVMVLGAALVGLYALGGHETNIGKILGSKKPGVMTIKMPQKALINEPFQISLIVDTQGQKINAVGLYLQFDPKKLQLVQIDTRPSFCQFYPEKKFDNQLGTVSLACGSPHPGMSGLSTMMILDFIPIDMGDTYIRTVRNSQILLSDGKGTNILKDFPAAQVKVVNNL